MIFINESSKTATILCSHVRDISWLIQYIDVWVLTSLVYLNICLISSDSWYLRYMLYIDVKNDMIDHNSKNEWTRCTSSCSSLVDFHVPKWIQIIELLFNMIIIAYIIDKRWYTWNAWVESLKSLKPLFYVKCTG